MGLQYENGDAQVRKVLDEAFASQNGHSNDGRAMEESISFCRNPTEYEWKCVGKQNMLIPYKFTIKRYDAICDLAQPSATNTSSMHLEMHNVWIVEGTLRRGESNVLATRRFYIDEESWLIVSGEGYNSVGKITSYYVLDKGVPDRFYRGRWVSDFLTA